MNDGADISVLATMAVAVLVLVGAATTLIGALGLLRLRGFYDRVHAPTLGTTLGTFCIATASMVHFSTLESRFLLHELLIVVFVTTTTPISLMVLVRAAIFRDESERENAPAGGAESERH
jgi:multicomponent K+:H+ antiporter subunit G